MLPLISATKDEPYQATAQRFRDMSVGALRAAVLARQLRLAPSGASAGAIAPSDGPGAKRRATVEEPL